MVESLISVSGLEARSRLVRSAKEWMDGYTGSRRVESYPGDFLSGACTVYMGVLVCTMYSAWGPIFRIIITSGRPRFKSRIRSSCMDGVIYICVIFSSRPVINNEYRWRLSVSQFATRARQ